MIFDFSRLDVFAVSAGFAVWVVALLAVWWPRRTPDNADAIQFVQWKTYWRQPWATFNEYWNDRERYGPSSYAVPDRLGWTVALTAAGILVLFVYLHVGCFCIG